MIDVIRAGVCVAGLLLAGAATAQTGGGGFQQSGLVGKLEGAQILTDPAAIPKVFRQAPMLDADVRAGKLPPVEQRVPQEPLVLAPLRRIGTYGGTWRRGFIGPGDSENGNRLMSADKPLFFDETGTKLRPNVVKAFEVSEDGKRTTLHLRRGMKWSDGAAFDADDFLFWFQDIYGNKDLVPSPAPEMTANGKPGRVVKIDDTTVAFEFDTPYFLFPNLLAGDTLVGGGSSRLLSDGFGYGVYAPMHYLKQFLPKYSSVEALNREAKAAGYDNWAQYFHYKSDWRLNRDMPTLGAWHMVQPITGQAWVLERNPYFYEVDREGNQLPYIDRVQMTLAENPEVINLRAIAGEFDYMERFIDLGKLPVFLENQERGHYKMHLDLGFNGADSILFPNMTYTADKEIGKWLATVEFRRALALGIDRDQLNQAFWLGLGTPGSPVPDKAMPESPPGEAWRDRWSTHDPALASKMLDELGLSHKDAEGYRVRTDNGQRLRLEIMVGQTLSPTWPQQAEMIVQQWREIGIAGEVKVLERSLMTTRLMSDQDQIAMWTNNGTESLYLYPRYTLPVDPVAGMMSDAYSKWYASVGTSGTKPTEPALLHAFELFRAAPSQPEQQRINTAQEIWKLSIEQQWGIGLVGLSPAFMGVRVVSNRLENVPDRTCISQHCRTPWSAHPEQWSFVDQSTSR